MVGMDTNAAMVLAETNDLDVRVERA